MAEVVANKVEQILFQFCFLQFSSFFVIIKWDDDWHFERKYLRTK